MYPQKFGHLSNSTSVTLSSTGVTVIDRVHSGCELSRMTAVITTSISSSGAVVVSYLYRPTPGSATGQVSLGTLTIPAASTGGQCVYKDINPSPSGEKVLLPGGEIVVSVTTAATSSGAASLGGEKIDSPLNAKAISNMVLSV